MLIHNNTKHAFAASEKAIAKKQSDGNLLSAHHT